MGILSRRKMFSPQGVFAGDSPGSRIAVRGLIFTAIAVSLIAFSHRIETLSYQNFVRDLKLDSTIRLIEIREKAENVIFDRVLELNGLAAVIAQKPTINPTEFNLRAVDFVLANPDVVNVAAAPDQVVSMVFPRTGNELTIGLDYRDNAAQYPKVLEAMQTGEGIITGPVDLVQGGRGIILRKPVYTENTTGSNTPWGLVSVVLDYDMFINNLGFPGFEDQYDILVKEVNAGAEIEPQVLYGDPAITNNDPVVLDLNFPFGDWQLSVTPDGGWPMYRPGYMTRWIVRIALTAFSIAALWYVMHLSDRGRAAERQLSVGIEALEHGFVMFDADRRLVAFNRKYKQLAGGSGMVRVGARYEDIVKANLELGLIPDAVGCEEEWYENWSQRLETKASDNEQVLEDGRLIRAYDRPMEDGSVVGLRIDITDLKKAQMAAEAANKAKTDFMGVLSHELRTPLTVILGHARLAKNFRSMPAYKKLIAEFEDHPAARDAIMPRLDTMHDQISKMMEALERSGNHLFFLISEILDFAKIDSGTLVMDMEPTTIADIIDPVIDQTRPLVDEKGLKFVIERDSAELTGDCKRLQQVLINLIGNATKFTQEGIIKLSVTQNDEAVTFKVQDTGIGIPEEHVGKVFEAFHQVDSTSGRKFGGTGLGLAISLDIARAHDGDLRVESEVGKGSTFIMTIPREAAIEASATEEDTADQEELPSMVA